MYRSCCAGAPVALPTCRGPCLGLRGVLVCCRHSTALSGSSSTVGGPEGLQLRSPCAAAPGVAARGRCWLRRAASPVRVPPAAAPAAVATSQATEAAGGHWHVWTCPQTRAWTGCQDWQGKQSIAGMVLRTGQVWQAEHCRWVWAQAHAATSGEQGPSVQWAVAQSGYLFTSLVCLSEPRHSRSSPAVLSQSGWPSLRPAAGCLIDPDAVAAPFLVCKAST